jgi:hypothetical protein
MRLARQLDRAGLLYFFPSRSEYQRLRGTATQADYLRLAKKRIEVVAHSFGYAQRSQGVADELADILGKLPSLEITFAILDPRSYHVGSLARYLHGLPEPKDGNGSAVQTATKDAENSLRADIIATLRSFQNSKDRMRDSMRSRFTIKVYDALPIASVIMLDRGEMGGRAQVDIKVFGHPYHKSISFELGNDGEPYHTVVNAWGSLIESAEIFDPSRHLDGTMRAP